MLGAAFNLALLVLAIYFFGQGYFALAVASLLLFLGRLIYPVIIGFATLTRRIHEDRVAAQCNAVIEIGFSVERCLEHPDLQRLFDHFRAPHEGISRFIRPVISTTSLDDWRRQLSESYIRKYKREAAYETVRFNVKGHLLFKDDEPLFADFIAHSIDIPVVDGLHEDEGLGRTTVTIRVILVNGELRLQLGRFPKDASPHIYGKGSLGKYKTFVTISSFPLMYFHYRHGLPVRHLNLKADATESYVASLDESIKDKNVKNNRYSDWQALHRDLIHYRTVVVPAEKDDNAEFNFEKMDKARKALNRKRDILLNRNDFKDLNERRRDDDYGSPDFGDSYQNDYMHVTFQNLNSWRDDATDHWLRDYYEERP